MLDRLLLDEWVVKLLNDFVEQDGRYEMVITDAGDRSIVTHPSILIQLHLTINRVTIYTHNKI